MVFQESCKVRKSLLAADRTKLPLVLWRYRQRKNSQSKLHLRKRQTQSKNLSHENHLIINGLVHRSPINPPAMGLQVFSTLANDSPSLVISVAKVHGVWQADSGHARGAGDMGSPSTFLKFRIAGTNAWVDVYRSDKNGVAYGLKKTVELN